MKDFAVEEAIDGSWTTACLHCIDDALDSCIEVGLERPFHIGRASSADLQLSDASVSLCHAVLHRRGPHLLLSDLGSTNGTRVNRRRISGTVPIGGGDTISFGSSPSFCLDLAGQREAKGCKEGTQTLAIAGEFFPFVLSASLDRGPGPTAEFRSALGLQHRVRSENRCVLLFVLAKRMREDLSLETKEGLAGWVDDEQLRREIWGHTAKTMYPNNLQVLIRRLRKELNDNGFDGWCIQKHHGYTRVAVDVVLTEE